MVGSNQFLHLYGALESSSSTPQTRQYIRRQLRSVRGLLENPTPRQQIVGLKCGRVSKSDADHITEIIQIRNARALLKDISD